MILVFLFLNGVEVQQTLKSKFACTSATFCHMVSRRLSVYGTVNEREDELHPKMYPM
jgi:hypothetical protein